MVNATPKKVRAVYAPSLFRVLAWVTGHATVLIVIYTMIKITVFLLASARLQDQGASPPANVIRGFSTNVVVGTDSVTETTTPCDPTTTSDATVTKEDMELHTFFGVNLQNTGVSFPEAIIIFLLITTLNLPQLYAGLKLVEATDITRCPKNSISLAFLYQRTQYFVVAVELLFLGLVLYSTGTNLGVKGCHLCYTGMLGIFSKLVFIFTVGVFIDEQLKSISKPKKIIMLKKSAPNPTTSVRIPVNVLKDGNTVKIQMPPVAPPPVDQTKVETV